MAPRGWDCPARLCLQAGGHPGSSGIVPRAALLGTALTSGVTNQEKRSIVERVRESGRVFPVRGGSVLWLSQLPDSPEALWSGGCTPFPAPGQVGPYSPFMATFALAAASHSQPLLPLSASVRFFLAFPSFWSHSPSPLPPGIEMSGRGGGMWFWL